MTQMATPGFYSYTKEEYTHYIIGYISGSIQHHIDNGVEVDEKGLEKIKHLIDMSYKFLLAMHDFVYPGLEHYKVFHQMNEFETGIDLFYIKDGEIMPTPYGFKLTSLQKANLN